MSRSLVALVAASLITASVPSAKARPLMRGDREARASEASSADAELAEIARRIGDQFERVMRRQDRPQLPFMRRPVFAKTHGCVKARFDVSRAIPAALKVGAFAGPSYAAWIRFSNDGPYRADSSLAARGMAIKLVGVPGPKLLDGEEQSVTQDFVMQNHPVFFVDTAKDFMDFTDAALDPDPSKLAAFNAAHPETNRIFADMDRNTLADPLDGTYWTPTPYRVGASAMKYMVMPCATPPAPATKPMVAPDFLRQNMQAHLRQGDGCFKFLVQLQRSEALDPIDRATVPWQGELIEVARLTIPRGQNTSDPAREKLCENLSMTGWHARAEHEPLGTINGARRFVYKRMADARRARNGTPVAEPTAITPSE